MTRLWSLASVSLVCGMLVCAGSGCSQSEVPALAAAPEGQATAKKVLADWYAALAAAKTVAVDMADDVTVKQKGTVVESDAVAYRVAFERPQQLAVSVVKGSGVKVVSNGTKLFEFVEPKKVYQLGAAPASLSDVLDSQILAFANFGKGLPLVGPALKAKTADEFLATFPSIDFVGTEDLNGAKTQHLRVVLQDKLPVDVWFSADATRLLKFVPDMKTALKNAGEQIADDVELSMTIVFNNWTYDAPLPADAFAIAPPSDAREVDDVFAPPPHKLLGEQAPAFESTTLDGKPLKLAELAGKVVVLDFWATWCGPCVRALPEISATTAKYKDRGVVFFAVNQGEEASIIKEFFTSQKLDPPTLLDLEGKVGSAYAVEGIPQTVVIDKNGKIQVVHVGAGPGIGEKLAKELDDVLAGKDLATTKK
jgi:thiol-disulfide isomerase/thioredoxin/outer membrane lipoprotein-sorting protein